MYEQKLTIIILFFIYIRCNHCTKSCNNYYKNDVSKEPQNNFKKVPCMFVKH